jgi:hypothetical protein
VVPAGSFFTPGSRFRDQAIAKSGLMQQSHVFNLFHHLIDEMVNSRLS